MHVTSKNFLVDARHILKKLSRGCMRDYFRSAPLVNKPISLDVKAT